MGVEKVVGTFPANDGVKLDWPRRAHISSLRGQTRMTPARPAGTHVYRGENGALWVLYAASNAAADGRGPGLEVQAERERGRMTTLGRILELIEVYSITC